MNIMGRYGQDGLTLSDFDADHGYVLLGEAGLGKSIEFQREVDETQGAHLVSARRFIQSKLDQHPEWRTTIFIDGLDEIRVGGGDAQLALRKIINGLEALGAPQFRFSCRFGSYLGSGDWKEFTALLRSQEILILQLNPLNDHDIHDFVLHQGVSEKQFSGQSQNFQIETLKGNPLLINLWLTSIKNEVWPNTKSKILESACQALIREQADVNSSELPLFWEEVLNAAGLLFATMLIANKSGWARNETNDSEVLSLCDLESPQDVALHTAIKSKIFEGPSTCKLPSHRLIAEFLGARYLNQKIQDGRKVRRVLALLMRRHGDLMPDLQGIAAWLGTLNDQARTILMNIAPNALAYNGDTSRFFPRERKNLLLNLEQHIHQKSDVPSASALYTLMSEIGMPTINELTNTPVPFKNKQILAYLYLRGFSQVYTFRGIPDWEITCDNLLKIVRDHQWQSKVRCEALIALNKIIHHTGQYSDKLREILMELKEKKIADENHNLHGTLLSLMYPDELQPMEMWDFLVTDQSSHRKSQYQIFFANLIDRSNDRQIRELIESLCDRVSEVVPKLEDQNVAGVVVQLLARGLNLFGDELTIPELYSWFELVEYDNNVSQLIPVHISRVGLIQRDQASKAIRNWLSQRESIQFDLIKYGIVPKEVTSTDDALFESIALKIVGHSAPDGFRLWCLEHSVTLWDSYQDVAEELASWSVRVQEGWGPPLSDQQVAGVISNVPKLVQWNDQRLTDRAKYERENAVMKRKQAELQGAYQKQKQEKLKAICEQQVELAKGQCMPIILDELATVYFNNPNTKDKNPLTCLRDYFEDDMTLVQTTLTGFQSLLNLKDLPDPDQIIQIYEEGKRSYFALPFLAAMEEACQTGKDLKHLSEITVRRALGFYLTTTPPRKQYHFLNHLTHKDSYPLWYNYALEYYPKMVADSLLSVHNARVRSKNSPHEKMHELAFDPAYRHVAKIAVPQMFTVFPSRCSARKLESLRLSLWGAIVNHGLSLEKLKTIVSKRLKRKQMDLGQQAQWLSAGLIADRKVYISRLAEFFSVGEEVRVRHVMDFLVPSGDYSQRIFQQFNQWTSDEIRQMIQVFGRHIYPPMSMEYEMTVNDDQVISHKFQSLFTYWIGEIKQRISDNARINLDQLASDTNLSAWQSQIVLAQQEQDRNCHAKKYSDLSISMIHKALHEREVYPVNASDLLMLTLDALEELADSMHNDATLSWHHFWDWDAGQPINPKSNNLCIEKLKLSMEIKLGEYQINFHGKRDQTDDRRADIYASYGSHLSVPIVIKKNSHRDLWRAIMEGLVQNYTRDLKSDGYGIYVVFWFGADRKYMKVVPPEGGTPKNPSELKDLLVKRLTLELRKRIQVVVIDVSLPK